MAEIDCNGLDEPCVTWTGGVTRTGPRQYVLCGVDSETIFFPSIGIMSSPMDPMLMGSATGRREFRK